MKKRLAALLASLTGVAGLLAFCADIPVLNSGPVTVTTTKNVPSTPFNLSGQSTCAMTLAGGGSATITPMGSGDGGATYTAGTAQLTNGTYAVAVAGNITNFYVAVSGVTGTVTVTAVCSATVGTFTGGSLTAVVSPIPLPVIPTGVPTWPVDNNGIPIVTTPPPYVAPTCNPGSNNAACVQQLSVDPCADSTLVQRFVQATPASATGPIAMVTPSTGQFIHICSLRISVYPSAAPGQVVTLTQGTASNCGTSNTVVAAYELQSGLIMPNDRELFPGVPIVSSGFCYTTTTASPTSIGITFIQQ